MNSNSEMLKIKRYSNNLKNVLNVFYWISILGVCGSLIAAIVISIISDSSFVLSGKNIGHVGFSLDGLIRYKLNQTISQGINMKSFYISITVMSAITFVLLAPMLKQLILILKTVENGTPFSIDNANRISILGVLLIVSSFIIPAIEVYIAQIMIDTLGLQNVSTNYAVNIALILAGIIMFILSGIFKYGSYLQNEYDETV